VDRLAINALMGLPDVGVFGVAARIAQVVGLLMVAFQLALTPLIYQRYRDERTAAELAQIFRYFVGLALFAWVGLSLFAFVIVAILATDVYAHAATLIPLLVPATLLANMYVFAPGLALAHRTGMIALLNIGAAILNTVLNLLLIPILGTVGAALATLVSAGCLFLGYLIPSQRLFPAPHDWRSLFVGTAVALAAVAVGQALLPAGPLGFALRVGVLALVGAGLVGAGLIHPSELAAGWRSLRAPHPT
jgi:O-antigen/teichoic acid export membrane protein